MFKNYKKYLYIFDLIGITPQIRIFNNIIYNSLFSSLLSIFILIISLIFALYLIIDYFKFGNPLIIYYRDNDNLTNRTIFLNDTLLLLGLLDSSTFKAIDAREAYFTISQRIFFYNGTIIYKEIPLEKCEFGKNIESKYIKFFGDMKLIQKNDLEIKDFYCINDKYNNLSISYIPGIGEYSLLINIIIINKNFSLENIQSLILIEDDIISHNYRGNPINYYGDIHFNGNYDSSKFNSITYKLKYIKYESDNGLIFKNSQIYNAKSFEGVEYSQFVLDELNSKNIGIGSIIIEMSKFYEYYKRSYNKFQTLLTEIITITNLLLGIGHQICNIFLPKMMNNSIINQILFENYNENANSFHISNRLNKRNEKVLKNNMKNSNISLNEKTNSQKIKKNQNEIKLSKIKKNLRTIKKINYLDIIKSFFCFKEKKIKLINTCFELINKDLCIEKMLKRIYKFENIYNYIYDKDKTNFKKYINRNKSFKEVYNLIYKINNEMKIETNSKEYLNNQNIENK